MQVSFAPRNEQRIGRCGEIALQKRAADFAIPNVGPFFQEWDILLAHGRLPERAVSSILERAHHPGDITQGRAFQFSFSEWTGRFAFEIEEHEIAAGVECLPEMKIPMDADFVSGRPLFEQTAFLRENLLFGRENIFRFCPERFREVS